MSAGAIHVKGNEGWRGHVTDFDDIKTWVSPRQVFQSLRGPSSEKFQIFFPKSRPLEGSEYKILGHFTQPFSRYEFLNFGAFRPFQTWQRRGRAREKHETVLV